MSNVYFLDCTLRDGGYINDWRFGNLTIRSVVSRLDAAGVDYLEIGFLDSRRGYDNERSIFPDIPSIGRTLGSTHTKNTRLVAMIDYGTFDEDRLVSAEESCLYGIRLIFTKDKAERALSYARKIKEKGYHLFLNLVSTSSYQDRELLDLVEKINLLDPVAVSIVDTYGLMFGAETIGYALLLDKNLSKEIALGYHSHNNMQMSNANSMEFINLKLKRDIIVDSSLLGMGKNAGNACTELMLSYANSECIRQFDITQVLECAYIDIGKFQDKLNWGYKLEFLISAILRCSPNWTKHYMKKKSLSIKDIYNLLSELPEDKKYLPTYFTSELADKLMEGYINRAFNDTEARETLRKEVKGKGILLLCPGRTIHSHREEIMAYIDKNKPSIISVNYLPTDMKVDYVWISNSVRYSQLTNIYSDLKDKPRMLVTSNITLLPSFDTDMIFNFKNLREEIGGEVSAILILDLLLSLGVKEIAFAGFDGYGNEKNDYFDSGYFINHDVQANEKILTQLACVREQYGCKRVRFITPSIFEETRRNLH